MTAKRVGQVLVATVMAIALVLLTTGASGERPAEQVRGTLDGQRVRVNLPPTTEPKGVAIFFHGQGSNYNHKMDGTWLDALRRDGWVVASSMFHRENWGNPISTADTMALWDWAEEQGGGEVKLYIGASMGGTTSLNALVHGDRKPPCWYGVKPAVDMSTMGNVPGARRFISQAYDGRPYPRDRNPVDAAYKLAQTGTTFRFVASPRDPFVPYESNSGEIVSRLSEFGADVTLRTVDGPHDDPSHYSAYDLVTFANECAGTTTD